ncbi:DUF4838 domain-containing protein [Lignipirellula cremea]|uniref:Alpha glucuronidase N-terminal domain-containing protein n=1 Tax=Lignipirellula cremea TaxID=2528010 RepID=A0A518DNN1_9BACT|nr:DUF4838 domain-containing protein [Lignipirellula cremea]QDU93450.1 hypothetical protein Pla8534_12300 [Lignipirellula cremea]
MIKETLSACRSGALACLALLVSLSTAWVHAGEVVVARLPVEPETCYRLHFQVPTPDPSEGEPAQWLLRTVDVQGDRPFVGCHDQAWQQIAPDQKVFTHALQTIPGAKTLELVVRSAGQPPQIGEVMLEPYTPGDLLINGQFQEGPGNFSGWSEHLNCRFLEVEGKTALQVEHNGYALTDRIPVAGGANYRFDAGSTMPTYLLAYDADMQLLTPTPYNRLRDFRTPETAVWLRLLYQTSFDHIPVYRTRTITSVGLQRVEEGQAAAPADAPVFPGEIVLASNCDPREAYAARELQHWVHEITGKRLPLLAAPSARDNLKFFLGARWATDYEDDLKFLAGSDGYAVRRQGNAIYLFSAHPRGLLFGVCAFLEKNTDIIWPRPHADFAAIFSKTPNLEFPQADFRSRPAFAIRELNFLGGDRTPEQSQEWSGRNGANTPLRLGRGFPYLRWLSGATIGAGGGYIWNFLGLEQEDETLYPLVNGNRLRNMWRQPCYTHPGVPKVMADSAREMLESVPGREIEFLISRVGDNWEVCSCPECMQPIDLADGSRLEPQSTSSLKDRLFFSTRNYLMLNRMAEDLVKDYPDLKLHTHAYIFAAEPPKVKLHPAIVPHFAAYPTKDERYPILEQKSEEGREWGRRLRQWGEEQDVNFGFFGYYYSDGYNALADTAGPDYLALSRMGGIHAHCEGYPGDVDALNSWDYEGSEKWIMAKLQWDPSQDPAALREQYIQRTFRDAAGPMRAFYQLINASWHDPKNPTTVNCHTPGKEMFQKFLVDPGLEKQARAHLVEAQQVATDPRSRNLIVRMLAKFDQFAAELNRLIVPLVPESTEQWRQVDSPHWYKAHQVGDFQRIANWQPLPEKAETKYETRIAMMRDKTHLYFKIDAFTSDGERVSPRSRGGYFPQGDRVEIVLRCDSATYYLALGEDEREYMLKNWSTTHPWRNQVQVRFEQAEGLWTALVAVPLRDLEATPGKSDIDVKFGRVAHPHTPAREESTLDGRSIFANHPLLRSSLKIDE